MSFFALYAVGARYGHGDMERVIPATGRQASAMGSGAQLTGITQRGGDTSNLMYCDVWLY